MRTILARFAQRCRECNGDIAIKGEIAYDDETKRAYHPECAPAECRELFADPAAIELADSLGFRPHEELCPSRILRDLHTAD